MCAYRVENMLRNIIKWIPRSCNHVRTLYTDEALGVDKYLYSKERISSQFVNSSEKFKEKMREYTSTSENMIFTEDLKNMAHLVEDSPDASSDIELVERMMKKFNAQNKELRFGNFVFGKSGAGSFRL